LNCLAAGCSFTFIRLIHLKKRYTVWSRLLLAPGFSLCYFQFSTHILTLSVQSNLQFFCNPIFSTHILTPFVHFSFSTHILTLFVRFSVLSRYPGKIQGIFFILRGIWLAGKPYFRHTFWHFLYRISFSTHILTLFVHFPFSTHILTLFVHFHLKIFFNFFLNCHKPLFYGSLNVSITCWKPSLVFKNGAV